jgi:hypothetical protein
MWGDDAHRTRRPRLSAELELARHRLGLAEQHVAGSEAAQLAAAADATEAQLGEARTAGCEAAARKRQLQELAEVWERGWSGDRHVAVKGTGAGWGGAGQGACVAWSCGGHGRTCAGCLAMWPAAESAPGLLYPVGVRGQRSALSHA